ncbi:MAG TPA: hypothetical protein VK518_08145, partial [Puia sp.]|nr:hypothetical protein [Puia sp.]
YGSVTPSHQFRYVIVPGGVKATTAVKPSLITSNGKQLDPGSVNAVVQNYQQMSYAEVCQRLNVPE